MIISNSTFSVGGAAAARRAFSSSSSSSSSSSPVPLRPSGKARSFVTSLLPRALSVTGGTSAHSYPGAEDDLAHAVRMVRRYDPAGFLPGRLLPMPEMRRTYYAVRSLWVETGLRLGTTADVPPHSTPREHLNWWGRAVDELFVTPGDTGCAGAGASDDGGGGGGGPTAPHHPTLRLLQRLIQVEGQGVGPGRPSGNRTSGRTLSKCHFDDILKGRREDLDVTQYATMEELEDHAVWSCGSLYQLVLEADGIFEGDGPDGSGGAPLPHRAARLVGQAHGLANALRLSVPVVSATGRLAVPRDVCARHGVASPRYLLSALGLGDDRCAAAFRNAVEEVAHRARDRLREARDLRDEILALDGRDGGNSKVGSHSVAVLLPGLASEAFLDRLEAHRYDLTDRDLRNVGWVEHAECSAGLLRAAWQQRF